MPPKPVNKISYNLKYDKKVEKRANTILTQENVLNYIVRVANISHKSDEDLFKIAILSTIQHSIDDYNYGLYLNVVGSAGKGKSHSLNILTRLLPDGWVYKSGMSPKSLYQASEAGRFEGVNIIFTDDISFENPDLIETLKKATSEFDSEIMHQTLVNNQPQYFKIQSGLSYWFTSVASIPDQQLSSRFINISVDESKQTDIDVMSMMTKNSLGLKKDRNQSFNIEVCKCIFDKLCSTKNSVVAPFGEAIGYGDVKDRRLIQSFLSTFKCVTFINKFKRKTIDDQIIATMEDFNETMSIFSKIYETHKAKLSIPELAVYEIIKNNRIYNMTINDIIEETGGSNSRTRDIIKSLLEKTNMKCEKLSIKNQSNNKIANHYSIPKLKHDEVDWSIANKELAANGKLADIYIKPDIFDATVDAFDREAEEFKISDPILPPPIKKQEINEV